MTKQGEDLTVCEALCVLAQGGSLAVLGTEDGADITVSEDYAVECATCPATATASVFLPRKDVERLVAYLQTALNKEATK